MRIIRWNLENPENKKQAIRETCKPREFEKLQNFFLPWKPSIFAVFPASYKPLQFLGNLGVWLVMYIVPMFLEWIQSSFARAA